MSCKNFAGFCEFKLGGQQTWLVDSLAMFCGLATKLAQSFAPKHAMSPVAAREPQTIVDTHARVTGRQIHHKATLGLMGFAGSCSGLLRVPSDNASRSERASTASRCGTPWFAQPAYEMSEFLRNRSDLISCNFAGCHVSMEMHRRHRGFSMLRTLQSAMIT